MATLAVSTAHLHANNYWHNYVLSSDVKGETSVSFERDRFTLRWYILLLRRPALYAEQGLRNGRASVCPSVRLSHRSTAAAACDGFAAGRPPARDVNR